MPDDAFVEPPWGDPLDPAAVIAGIPHGATMKGMFLEAMVARARDDGFVLPSARPSYVAFRSYPLHEHCIVLVELARAAWPHEPLRQSLRRVGRGAAAAMLASNLGRVTVGAADEPVEILRQMAKTFSLVCDPGRIEVTSAERGRVILALRDVHFFGDCHHVGVYEGALRLARVADGKVRIRTRGPAAIDFLCTWR